MNFKTITSSDELWCKVRDYAENCSWGAGKALAGAMDNNQFNDWKRVIAAVDNEKVCGYCTVSKTDCIPDVDYMKNIGYSKVYIVSDHVNLYEKYGFRVIDQKIAPWGSEEKIYLREF